MAATKNQSQFDADEMFGWVKRQAEMGERRAGSPAGAENEDFLEAKLQEFGLESVRREPISVTYWEAQNVSLTVSDGDAYKPVDAFPIPYAAFTPVAGVEAPLVYADPGKLFHPRNWRGSIVVTEIGFPPLDISLLSKFSMGMFDPDETAKDVHHPATWVRLGWHLYRKAAKRGAVGFIGIVKDQPGGSCQMYAPYGFKEKDILDKPLPGFWVGREDGARLRDLAQTGSGRARITLTGIRRPAVTHNIVGEIPGDSEEVMVIHSHHGSPFISPVEDASGVSVVLSLAKHFAERRDIKRRLIVLFTAGHFYGSIGTRTFISRHQTDIVARTAVEISIEHIAREAVEDDNGVLVPTGHPEFSGIFVPLNRCIADIVLKGLEAHDVRRVIVIPAEGPLGDFPPTDGGDWYAAGVPVINHISNPVYLLTAEDALEWVDRERMARVAGVFADVIREVDGIPRESIGAVDSWRYLLKMKLVKHIARARTTFFGLKPVY